MKESDMKERDKSPEIDHRTQQIMKLLVKHHSQMFPDAPRNWWVDWANEVKQMEIEGSVLFEDEEFVFMYPSIELVREFKSFKEKLKPKPVSSFSSRKRPPSSSIKHRKLESARARVLPSINNSSPKSSPKSPVSKKHTSSQNASLVSYFFSGLETSLNSGILLSLNSMPLPLSRHMTIASSIYYTLFQNKFNLIKTPLIHNPFLSEIEKRHTVEKELISQGSNQEFIARKRAFTSLYSDEKQKRRGRAVLGALGIGLTHTVVPDAVMSLKEEQTHQAIRDSIWSVYACCIAGTEESRVRCSNVTRAKPLNAAMGSISIRELGGIRYPAEPPKPLDVTPSLMDVLQKDIHIPSPSLLSPSILLPTGMYGMFDTRADVKETIYRKQLAFKRFRRAINIIIIRSRLNRRLKKVNDFFKLPSAASSSTSSDASGDRLNSSVMKVCSDLSIPLDMRIQCQSDSTNCQLWGMCDVRGERDVFLEPKGQDDSVVVCGVHDEEIIVPKLDRRNFEDFDLGFYV
ncbi:hypothetical protein ADUPG1_010398 [Aduncisulcus paluster]|uniref:Uncharacterized protein n=1 Tax=Aduncisulcus paluster TaxID=2918883 RepID=A0ABQ5JTQ6_9EUKA|nr:hypothetical protein ADUPG1_010398 [Aduncisulcus paluster]